VDGDDVAYRRGVGVLPLRLIMAALRAPVLSATSRMERSWIMAGLF